MIYLLKFFKLISLYVFLYKGKTSETCTQMFLSWAFGQKYICNAICDYKVNQISMRRVNETKSLWKISDPKGKRKATTDKSNNCDLIIEAWQTQQYVLTKTIKLW